jgi:hypothetical protein
MFVVDVQIIPIKCPTIHGYVTLVLHFDVSTDAGNRVHKLAEWINVLSCTCYLKHVFSNMQYVVWPLGHMS